MKGSIVVPSPAAYRTACAIVRDYQKHVKTNHQLEMAIRIGSELKLKDAEVMRISEILQNEPPNTVEIVQVIDGSSFEVEQEPEQNWSNKFPCTNTPANSAGHAQVQMYDTGTISST